MRASERHASLPLGHGIASTAPRNAAIIACSCTSIFLQSTEQKPTPNYIGHVLICAVFFSHRAFQSSDVRAKYHALDCADAHTVYRYCWQTILSVFIRRRTSSTSFVLAAISGRSSRDRSRGLRLGVTYEKGVTLGNVTMSHRTRERPAECLASLSHSTMIGLPRAQH
ncbi:hypothetical protein EVAR_102517_1 [Eumeta japonica]|uniref:Uncharacterized protein n=1 Tax=Eumeta variegata TaxID=151549 RepID=A0A4C2AGP3_EUMVA|nr:hypothetical protein EVAR_102517_1 [Eumeta japonica]